MTADWMPFGNCVAAAMLAAVVIWIVAKGVHALLRLRKVVLAVFLAASFFATLDAQKTNILLRVIGPMMSGNTASPTVTDAEVAKGYREACILTNEHFSYAMPSNATLVGNWHKRGTFGEWMRLELGDFAFPIGTNATAYSSFSVFNDGKIRPIPRDVAHEICAVGVPMLAMQDESRFWVADGEDVVSWARKVFPELDEEAAMERLWEEIFKAVRITEDGDAVAEWRAHCERIEGYAKRMTEFDFAELHYKNSIGTDLTVKMPENHMWLAGGDYCKGVKFVANMPTEEVFSAPLRTGVDGTLVAAKPLVLNGNVIEGIRFRFENGRIVDIHADKGEETLRAEVELDEGSHYLGEIALVPYDSPISNSGILFFNTLFDENAACHFAFGEAYPACIKGGDDLSEDELKAAGINAESNTHVDFMVGTKDLEIVGTTRGGRRIKVFENGNFAI